MYSHVFENRGFCTISAEPDVPIAISALVMFHSADANVIVFVLVFNGLSSTCRATGYAWNRLFPQSLNIFLSREPRGSPSHFRALLQTRILHDCTVSRREFCVNYVTKADFQLTPTPHPSQNDR